MYKLVRISIDMNNIQVKTWKSHPSDFRVMNFLKHWLPSFTGKRYYVCFVKLKEDLNDEELIKEIDKALKNESSLNIKFYQPS